MNGVPQTVTLNGFYFYTGYLKGCSGSGFRSELQGPENVEQSTSIVPRSPKVGKIMAQNL